MHWERFEENPLILPEHVPPLRPDFEVASVLNPAATVYDGEIILLLRVGERPVQEEGYLSTIVFDPDAPEPGLQPLRYKLDDPLLSSPDPRVFRYDGRFMLATLSTSTTGPPTPLSPAPKPASKKFSTHSAANGVDRWARRF